MIDTKLSANSTTHRRYRIWTVALLIVGILGVAAIFQAWSGYHGTLVEEQQRLLRSGALNAQKLQTSLIALRNGLIFLERQAEVLNGGGDAALYKFVDSARLIDPDIQGLALLNPAGTPLWQSYPDSGNGPDGMPLLPERLKQRLRAATVPSLETALVFADQGTAPGNIRPVRAVLAAATAGAGKGIIVAVLPADFYNRMSALLEPDPVGSSASIVDEDDIIAGRHPDIALAVGRNVATGPTMTELRQSGSPAVVSLTGSIVDGETKAISGHRFRYPGLPHLTLISTRDVNEIAMTWQQRAAGDALLFGLSAAAILILASLASRREVAFQQTAAAIAESSGIYQGLFEGSKAVKLLVNPGDGQIVDANGAACAFYGRSKEELKSLNISDINVMSSDEVHAEMTAARDEKRNHFYFRHKLASGEIRDVEVHSGPITYRDRQLLYSLVLDITDRRRLERERQLLVTAIEQSPASVIITDAEGAILYVNPAFSAISGYTSEEIIGQNPRILKSGHTTDAEYLEMWAALTQGRSWSATFLNRRKDGTTYWEHAQIAPVINDAGKVTHYVGVKENVSELKEAEDWLLDANAKLGNQTRKLQQANAELEQFAYVASHDLRQPLRAVTSYMKLVERAVRDKIDSDTQECLDFALDGAKRMDTLIVGLLEYSRVGRQSQPFAPVSLAETIRLVVMSYALDVEDSGGALTVAPGLPAVTGNAAELERLFTNLIGNALKYRMEERPPQIHIDWARTDAGVTIWVQDNGIGIDAKDFDRAFGMFQRLVSRERFEGTGIGLAVCKKIVEHHGGKIWIESEPEIGSRFLIAFPAEKIVEIAA